MNLLTDKKITTSVFPGDELIEVPKKIITHSITINAPSYKVWPWLVQLGSGRAGWYSYDRIDNGSAPSAKQIIPELQNIKVGDIMPAVPGSKDVFIIRQLHLYKSIVLVVPIQTSDEVPDPLRRMKGPLRVSWLLMLESLDNEKTKLISRGRISDDWLKPSKSSTVHKKPIFIERVYGLLAKLPWFILLPIAQSRHSIMESKMLRGIKSRVELDL